MKTSQEKAMIALDIIARAKLVNQQTIYDNEELEITMNTIEKQFVDFIENDLTNQNFYVVFLEWLKSNVKELITKEPYCVYLIANVQDGVVEVESDFYDNYWYAEYIQVSNESFYNALKYDDYNVKSKFPSNSTLLVQIIEEYGRSFA